MGDSSQHPDASIVVDDFDSDTLNRTRWIPAYLPAWSSRSASAASWTLAGSRLRLFIPPDQPIWCEGDHHPALRVSALQSGNFSGPAGRTIGQQPYRQGLVVREEQAPFWGWTPQGGVITIRARAILTQTSMFSFWLIGTEVDPTQCAEICIVELFGKETYPDGTADVGSGVHAFRDPGATEDFVTIRRELDPGVDHEYSVRWLPEHVITFIDGDEMRRVERPPFYPMQPMMAVFDFPDLGRDEEGGPVPELIVDWIAWEPLSQSDGQEG